MTVNASISGLPAWSRCGCGFDGIPQAARASLRNGMRPIRDGRSCGGSPAPVGRGDDDLVSTHEQVEVRTGQLKLNQEHYSRTFT